MTNTLHNRIALLLPILFFLSVLPFFLSGTFHDSQRILSIFFISLLLFYVLLSSNKISKNNLIFILFYLVFGFISSLFSLIPLWSFIEFFLFLNILLLTSLFFLKIDLSDIKFLAYIFSFIQSIYTTRILMNYIFTILDKQMIDNSIIIDGFSNIRFYAQFLSWTIPFITAYLVIEKNNKYTILVKISLILSWSLAFFSGTRAFTFGIFLSVLAVKIFIPNLWRSYFIKTLITGLLGFTIYMGLTLIIPNLLHIDNSIILNNTINRDFSNSSNRLEIWLDTLHIVLTYPYLGSGPMMTASDNLLPFVAHPHNSILQLAAEWGIPFTILLITSISYYIILWRKKIINDINNRSTLALPITASISSAFCVSLVDGVIVMPISLMYFCIIVGAAVTLSRNWSSDVKTINLSPITISALLAVVILFLVITSAQWLRPITNTQTTPSSPRFWANGKLQKDQNLSFLDFFTDN